MMAAREAVIDRVTSFQELKINLNIDSKVASEFVRILAEAPAAFENIAHNFSFIMIEAKWPPLPSLDLYPSEMIQIIKHHTDDADSIGSVIEEFVIGKYGDQEINSLLARWKQRAPLRKRIPILEEVIEAHNKGQYFVSIAALLPQIEGIIADGYGHCGELRGSQYKEFAKSLLNDKRKLSFDQMAEDFLLNIILVNFKHGQPLDSFLSRHAILHGGDVGYGTRANSLRCILLFDYLQNRFPTSGAIVSVI